MATLLFDLDGTLLDVRRRHIAVYTGIMHELVLRPLPEVDYWRRRRDGESTFAVAGDLPDETAVRFRDLWFERIERPDFLALDRPHEGAIATLTRLAREHRLVLVTLRHEPDALADQLAATGLASLLADIRTPSKGETLTRKATLLPDWYPLGDTWVIGDGEADIELAADFSAPCICVTNGVRSAEFLRSRGQIVLAASVTDLPSFFPRRPRRRNRKPARQPRARVTG